MADFGDTDYDEEDDGFAFTRTRSKRAKAALATKPVEPVAEEVHEEAPRPATAKKPRKRSLGSVETKTAKKAEAESRPRRSTRNSGDRILVEPLPVEVKKRRPKEKAPPKPTPAEADEPDPVRADAEDLIVSDALVMGRISSLVGGQVDIIQSTSQVQVHPMEGTNDVTKIALPFADTPIIRRNKEMRKGGGDGSRRSSLGMRGRRASSLIDSGKSNGKNIVYFAERRGKLISIRKPYLMTKLRARNSINILPAILSNQGG